MCYLSKAYYCFVIKCFDFGRNKFVWSREATTILIELYEGFPCLYEVSLEDYHNKNKRVAAIEEITLNFNNRNFTSLSSKLIQEKIHGIRSQFLAELNKIKKSKASGAGADQTYIPKLWCFDMLKFIQKGAPVTEGESNLQKDDHLQDIQESSGTDSVVSRFMVVLLKSKLNCFWKHI